MARRIEAGPIVVVVGALLLLVALFLEWFDPGANAWTVFEALDLVLAGLAVGAALAALGLLLPELATIGRRWMAPLAFVALVVVASQLIDPPPAVVEGDLEAGAWLALAATLLLVAGALLSFSRVRLAVTVEGRDPRRRQAAVDAREREDVQSAEGPGGSRTAPAPDADPSLAHDPVDGLDTQRMPPPTGAAAAPSAPLSREG